MSRAPQQLSALPKGSRELGMLPRGALPRYLQGLRVQKGSIVTGIPILLPLPSGEHHHVQAQKDKGVHDLVRPWLGTTMRKEEGELFQGCIYTSGLKQLNWKVSLENSEQPGAREGGNLLYHLPTKKLPSDNPELPCLYCSLPSVRQQKWHWWPRCVMDIGLVGVAHIIPLFSHHFPLRWTPPSILILPRQG